MAAIPEAAPTQTQTQTLGAQTRCARAALLVDGAAYFRALRASFERAQRSIAIAAWDVHSAVELAPDAPPGERCELAELLDGLTRRRPELRVRILAWDFAAIYLTEREFMPMVQFAWKTGRSVHLQLDAVHPVGASHHQKLVVVDDATAFLGGIDLTVARWDERSHLPAHPARRFPDGKPYGPFHDLQLCVDGDAAAELGTLFRERWWRATGDRLPACAPGLDAWPEHVTPDFQNVPVRLLRTRPTYRAETPLLEVEQRYIEAIASARQSIYIENQFLTAEAIKHSLTCSLQAPEGPEIVIVTPKEQSGRLEQATLGVLRARMVRALREADVHGRLRVLSPVVGAQQLGVNVHAKLMIVDDALLRVGSANLTNRSMRLDSECDAEIEADSDGARRRIHELRDDLLAEHLGVEPATVTDAIARAGSLARGVDALRAARERERTLVELETEGEGEAAGTGEAEGEAALILDSRLIDPTEPVDEALARRALPPEAVAIGSRRLPRVLLGAALAAGLGAAWLWTPLGEWAEPVRLALISGPARQPPLSAALATACFALASLLMLPVTVLIVVVALLFEAWLAMLVAAAGSLASAACAHAIGRVLWHDVVRKLAGRRLDALSRKLAQRGPLAIAAVRVVPVAPFTVVNLVAGASRIGFKEFMLGTAIGMTPGIVALCLAADGIASAVRDPRPLTIAVAVALFAAVLGLLTFMQRFAARVAAREDARELRDP